MNMDLLKPNPHKFEKVWDLNKHGLTQGSIELFESCPEKFRLAVQYQLASKRYEWSSPLSFGSAFHDMIEKTLTEVSAYETKYRTVEVLVDVLDDVYPAYRAKTVEDTVKNTAISTDNAVAKAMSDIDQAYVILKQYFHSWGGDFSDKEWVSLEKEFKIMYSIPGSAKKIPLRGKIDGIFRKEGRLWLFETKTKSKIDDQIIFDSLSYQLQVQMYMFAIEQIYGEPPAGVLYNMVLRPQLRQKVKESNEEFLERIAEDAAERPEHYLMRYEAEVTIQEMSRWRQELMYHVSNINDWNDEKFHYRRSSTCGNVWGGGCEFQPICANGNWNTVARKHRIFQELTMADVPQE